MIVGDFNVKVYLLPGGRAKAAQRLAIREPAPTDPPGVFFLRDPLAMDTGDVLRWNVTAIAPIPLMKPQA